MATKSIITNNIPTELTTVYTNETELGAVLKAVNINGIPGDGETIFIEQNKETDWTFLGTSAANFTSTYAASGTGFGYPMAVQLSSDRILLFYLPHFQHWGGTLDYLGGKQIHTQICEYNNGKYVAGPITNITLPTAPFNSSTNSLWTIPTSMSGGYGQTCFRAVALNPNVVVVVYRIGNDFRLLRLNIVGNVVDRINVENLDLSTANYFNSTTPYAFDLSKVPEDSTKVIVGGRGSAATWSLQAYNIPERGALSNSSPIFNTQITASAYAFTVSNVVKTPTESNSKFIVVGTTAASTFNSRYISFNNSDSSFTLLGNSANGTSLSGNIQGLQAMCLSANTTPRAIVASTQSGSTNIISLYDQVDQTQANALSNNNFILQSSLSRGIHLAYNWGDERAVFLGENLLVACNSANTAYNMLPDYETVDTNRIQQQYYPFNSRPLFSLYDPATKKAYRVPQLYAMTGMSSNTSFGTISDKNTYFPYGHNYGGHYCWSDVAGCWFVGSGGKIYAIDEDGVVLDEIDLYRLNTTFNYLYKIKNLTVMPSGKLVFTVEYGNGIVPSYNCWTAWNSLVNTLYGCCTNPITSPKELKNCKLLSTPVNIAGMLSCSLISYVDYYNIERVIALKIQTLATPLVSWAIWDGITNNWMNGGGTSIASTTAGAWNVGFLPQYKMLQTNNPSLTTANGTFRIYGPLGTNSLANTSQFRVTAAEYEPASFGSHSMGQQITTINPVYGICFDQKCTANSNMQVVASITSGNTLNVYASYNGRAVNRDYIYGWQSPNSNNELRIPSITVGKYGYTVAVNNSNNTTLSPLAYTFNAVSSDPIYRYSANTSNTSYFITKPKGKTYWAAVSPNTNITYNVTGKYETSKIDVTYTDNNGNTFYITSNTQPGLSTMSQYRNTDNYFIPPGSSIQIKSEVPRTLTSMLSVVEEE